MEKRLQIVAFDVPYPANYGGVIDVFYKLRALHKCGVQIILHTFEYGRGKQIELEKYCAKVYYYPRNSFLKSFFSLKPFVVKTRENTTLKKRLKFYGQNILFEGLHTTSTLSDTNIESCNTFVRTHNIEHNYYKGLAKSDVNYLKKIFFVIEAVKLKFYQKQLHKSKHIFTISPDEQSYFASFFGEKASCIPVFSEMDFKDLKPSEKIVLWHGDLRVSDNEKSALFAIEVLKNTRFKLVIASSISHKKIKKACKQYRNVYWKNIVSHDQLQTLFAMAQVNLMFTYQATGIKLKLINALTQSRFVVVNNLMIAGTGLEHLCSVVNSKSEILKTIEGLMELDFTTKHRQQRKLLMNNFNTEINAQKIMSLLK